MKPSDYHERLGRVRDHIYDHLDEPLDFMRLAEVACLSPHHWHRIYHALHGETVFATVRRLRLHRAAYDLAFTDKPIAEVAARSGYDSVAAFSRAFAPAYGMPPARYRREGRHADLANQANEGSATMRTVEIRTPPAMRLAGVEHVGPYMQVGRAFDQLNSLFAARRRYGPGQKLVAVYYDDASLTPPEKLRALAAFSVADDAAIEPPLKVETIAAGAYAVLRHLGPYAELQASYDWLFGVWLPQSGREAADRPCYEVYVNTPMDAAPKDLITDIHLPLR